MLVAAPFFRKINLTIVFFGVILIVIKKGRQRVYGFFLCRREFEMSKKDNEYSFTEENERLARAFLSLSDIEECRAFFFDIFTTREIEDLSSRLEVARLLGKGVNYIEIAERTGASTATISRVSKCLSGELGGYRTVLSKIDGSIVKEAGAISTDGLSESEIKAVMSVIECFRSKK